MSDGPRGRRAHIVRDAELRAKMSRTRGGASIRGVHLIAALFVFLALPAIVAWRVWSADGDAAGSAGGRSDRARTVVLIVLDGVEQLEVRQHALQGVSMPNLGELARGAAWFDRHYAQSNGTNSAFASLLTGEYASDHGIGSLSWPGHQRLSESATTIAEDMQAAGYRTHAALALPQFDAELSGFAQGFDVYDCPPLGDERGYRSASETRLALELGAATDLESDRPLFALLHFADGRTPHEPVAERAAPILRRHLESFRESMIELDEALGQSDAAQVVADSIALLKRRRGHAAWKALQAGLREAALSDLDAEIGLFFEQLGRSGRFADALIAVVGNTGRQWKRGDENGPYGALPLARQHVPFLLRNPNRPRAKQVHSLSRVIDVRATLTSVCSVASTLGAGTDLSGT